MSTSEVSSALTAKLTSLGQIEGASIAERVLSVIREFLIEAVDLPSKAVLLQALSDSLDKVFAGVDTPGPDMITEPALKALLLGLAGFIYDQIEGNSLV